MPLEDFNAQVNTTAPAPQAPTPPTAPTEPAPLLPPVDLSAEKMSAIRTFQGDLAGAMQGESLTSIAVKESMRRRRDGGEAPEEKKWTRMVVGASILFVILGLGLVTYFAVFRKTDNTTVVGVKKAEPLIFSDDSIDVTSKQFQEGDIPSYARRALAETNRKIGAIENYFFYTGTTDAKELLTAQLFLPKVGKTVPDGFVRSVDPFFMYGIYAGARNSGFLLLKTATQEKTYSELLSWEPRGMAQNLLPLLHEEKLPTDIESTPFSDLVVKNIDTRVLKDTEGNVVLLYAFVNPTTLVMAGSEDAFVEVLRRFTTPKPVVR